jgi:hypothetical protein
MVNEKRWIMIFVVAAAALGCGSSGDDTLVYSLGGSEVNVIGDLRLPLVTPGPNAFRLRHASFDIESRSGSQVFVHLDSESAPDALELRATLPQGPYAVTLQDGWALERLGQDAGATAVNAALLSDNPRSFDILDGQLTRLVYEFTTSEGVVRLGEGDVALGISYTPSGSLAECDVLDPASCAPGRTCLLATGDGDAFCAQPGSLPVGAACSGEQCVAGAQCLALDGEAGGARCRQFCSLDAPPPGCSCRSLDFDPAIGVCIDAAPPGDAPAPCTAGTDPGPEASPWVVCQADAASAWVSADVEGFYHVDQICRSLGYAGMSQFGGTCGNVCGYCEEPTSCEAPGQRIFDGAGDCGEDELGLQICFTVMWECVR